MTLSPEVRRANLGEALIAFLAALGDNRFNSFYIARTDYPDVLPTTWTELTSRALIRDMNLSVECYRFTPSGYVAALELSGRSGERQFREGLGNLCRVLKDSLRDRTQDACISFSDLVRASGVSQAFAYNALDADLIRRLLRRKGAEWLGDQLVRIPHDFGLSPL